VEFLRYLYFYCYIINIIIRGSYDNKKKFFAVLFAIFISGQVFSEILKVKSPNGGESWELGNEKQIEWQATGDFTKFHIILLKGGAKIGAIAMNLGSNTTSFTWKKVGETMDGTAVAGDDYKIRIKGSLANGSKLADASDQYFSIISKSTNKFVQQTNVKLRKRILDISPSKGNFSTGQEIKISWKTNWQIDPKDTFFLTLYNDIGKRYKGTIGTSTPGAKSLKWTIPGDIRPEFYTIKIAYREYRSLSQWGSQEETSAFSGMFHIAKGMFKTWKKEIPGRLINQWKYHTLYDHTEYESCKDYLKYEYIGPASHARVGYEIVGGSEIGCFYTYRCKIDFDLSSLQGRGSIYIQKASLEYKRIHGLCQDKVNVWVLEEKWTEGSRPLTSVKRTLHGGPEDLISVVQNWLAFPNHNYGIVLAHPVEEFEQLPPGPNRPQLLNVCVSHYENVRLVLEVKSEK
jgi:hypothetical protein